VQRLVADNPDLVGGAVSWLSSFTLASTEVTDRAQIPWLTLSSDRISAPRSGTDDLQTAGVRMLGVVSHATNLVEHSQRVADRILRPDGF
jgi:hypothetical protein